MFDNFLYNLVMTITSIGQYLWDLFFRVSTIKRYDDSAEHVSVHIPIYVQVHCVGTSTCKYGLIQDNSSNKISERQIKKQKVFKQVSIATFQTSFFLESRQLLLGLFPLNTYFEH